jgi:hypothetical protein
MIAVRIPKEIRSYEEKLFFGLTVRQMVCSALAIGICVPLYIWGKNYIPEDVVSWLIMVAALPLAGFGFIKYNGMTFEVFLAAMYKTMFAYPARRPLRSANCFREWQETTAAEDRLRAAKEAGKPVRDGAGKKRRPPKKLGPETESLYRTRQLIIHTNENVNVELLAKLLNMPEEQRRRYEDTAPCEIRAKKRGKREKTKKGRGAAERDIEEGRESGEGGVQGRPRKAGGRGRRRQEGAAPGKQEDGQAAAG